jgi:uncharacterized membrane protein
MVIWIGGMLMESVAVRISMNTLQRVSDARDQTLLRAVHEWDRHVTSIAMIVTWAAGITLAVNGNWFGEAWLTTKLVLVVMLSALHGMLVGTIRRLLRDEGKPNSLLAFAPWLIVGYVTLIAVLVVIKPGT